MEEDRIGSDRTTPSPSDRCGDSSALARSASCLARQSCTGSSTACTSRRASAACVAMYCRRPLPRSPRQAFTRLRGPHFSQGAAPRIGLRAKATYLGALSLPSPPSSLAGAGLRIPEWRAVLRCLPRRRACTSRRCRQCPPPCFSSTASHSQPIRPFSFTAHPSLLIFHSRTQQYGM